MAAPVFSSDRTDTLARPSLARPGVASVLAALAMACSASDGASGEFAATGGTTSLHVDGSVSAGGAPGASGFSSSTGGVGGRTAAGGAAGVPNANGGVVGAGGIPVGTTGGAPSGGMGTVVPPALTPVYRIPLRIHMALSNLTNADLGPILDELNRIWLSQGGICFEVEVTNDETNRTDGFDF